MKNNKTYIAIGIVSILFVVWLFGSTSNNDSDGEKEKTKDSIPEFSLIDYDGNTFTSSDITTPAIINVWATWCPFCKNELPDFVVLQKEFPEIRVIAINRGESREDAISFSESIGLEDITWLLDEDNSFYQSIGGLSMPETLFVNEEGKIIVHKRGPMRLEEMKIHAEKIIIDNSK